jgi:hypothetical protein
MLYYVTIEDMINGQVSKITFPGIDAPGVSQDLHHYKNVKRNPFQMDQLASKELTLTLKTSESLLTYFIMRRQFDLYLRLGSQYNKPLYMGNVCVSLLSDGGYATFTYVFKELTMTSLSTLDLSYAATLGTYNTFTANFRYNYYDVYMLDENGAQIKVTQDFDPIYDGPHEYLDSDKIEYKKVKPISTKINELKATNELNMSAKKTSAMTLKSVSHHISGNNDLLPTNI